MTEGGAPGKAARRLAWQGRKNNVEREMRFALAVEM